MSARPSLSDSCPPEDVETAMFGDDCVTCGEGCGEPNECPKSKRDCGHHCNHIWTHDACCWCGHELPEDGDG